jgi:DNA replication protein DnaC
MFGFNTYETPQGTPKGGSAEYTLLVSNCPEPDEDEHSCIGNQLLASAALDRLTHHAHLIVITGDGYRQCTHRKEVLSKA